jgi:hypothetical protein
MKKVMFGAAGSGCALPVGCTVITLMFVVGVLASAGSILGWLFGGGAPDGQGNALKPPSGELHFWTPTPVPSDCFITPTPQMITLPPNTPNPGSTPGNTPVGTGGDTPGVSYLPTATPCPPPQNTWPTPDPSQIGIGTPGQPDFDIRQGTISADKISQILAHYPLNGGPNPLAPYAQQIADMQSQYGINAGFALAWFVQESGLCTTGISPSAIECGNIIWTPGGNCVTHNYAVGHDFCGYASWPDAAEAWFRLMRGYYLSSNLNTVRKIVYVYAPCSDNGGCDFVEHYISDVIYLVKEWDAVSAPVAGGGGASGDNNVPHGSPFRSNYVVTQAYGCTDFPEFRDTACASATGGRAPFFHRGLDIVAMGDKTVYATISGECIYAGFNNDGFGIRVYLQNGPYLTIYPHLSRVLVRPGQPVEWGQPIGVEGSTGYSTGDHLHMEIHVSGSWVDPVPYLQTP